MAQLKVLMSSSAFVALITLTALAQRMYLALRDSLPLGDGGMFYVVIEQIKANDYLLPSFVLYDEMEIPFAYSPLTFYIGALTSDVLGVDSLQVMRFLPVMVSSLTIPAFYLLAKSVLNRSDASLVATAFFAADASFATLIMGGGLTRSFGFLFALLAVYHLYLMTKGDRTPRRALFATLFPALTVLSHQEMAWLVALFYVVMLCAFTRSWRDLTYPVCVGLLSLALTAGWWGVVLERHGIEPYLAALDSGTRQTLLPLGLVAVPLSRRWFVPALVIASIYFGGRNLIFPLAISMSLLVGALTGWFLPRLQPRQAQESVIRGTLRILVSGAVATVVLLMGVSWLISTDRRIDDHLSRPAGEAASFQWIRDATSPDSRFVIIADTDEWGLDHTGEWLPALTDRLTLTTVQGREWLSGAEGYRVAKAGYGDLRNCVKTGLACLEAWRPVQDVDFTHVYITKDECCVILRESLAQASGYRLAYDGPGAQIYERLNLPGVD